MALLSNGSRGPAVTKLQTSLNSLPSGLPKLVVDGIFGSRTQARVVEFQRKNGLAADGLAGPQTLAKLDALMPPPTQRINLAQAVAELSLTLRPTERSTFAAMAQPMIIANPAVLPAAVIEAMLLLLILMLMATILINSQNPASRRAGQDLKREIDRMMEKLRDHPETSDVVANEALDRAKKEGRALEQRARAERKKCFDRFTPQQLEEKLKNCASLSKALDVLLDSLNTILGRPLGGGGTGFHPQDIIRGISRVSGEIIQALRDLGTCMGCDNLFF